MDHVAILNRLRPHFVSLCIAVVGLVFLFVGVFASHIPKIDKSELQFEAHNQQQFAAKSATKPEKTITVDVEGAVNKPGVYALPTDSRVQDAINIAGGMSLQADREKIAKGLNLAAKVTDGGKIYIPHTGEQALAAETASSGGLNINTASASELDKLPGVGQVTAEKIIANRPYGSLEELVSKKAISQKVFGQIKEKVSLY